MQTHCVQPLHSACKKPLLNFLDLTKVQTTFLYVNIL